MRPPKKASPFRGGGSAKPRRRGRAKFVTTSQSALRLTAPLKGEPFPLRRVHPSGPSGQLPLTKGALGAGVKKPPLPGEVARRSRDGEVAANLRRPLRQPAAASSRTASQLQLPCGVFVGGLVVLQLAAGELHGLAELALEELGQGAEGVGLAEVFRGGLILLLFAG